jgi:hypothetical protein
MALKIHHLNCGTMCPHGAPFINGYGKITDNGHMVCHCLLIESNDGLVLVDTGFGIADVKNPNQRLGHAFTSWCWLNSRLPRNSLYANQRIRL